MDLHRRVPLDPNLLARDQVTGHVLGPSSAAFRPGRDEDGLSVYRDRLLRALGHGPARIAAAGSKPSVVAGLAAGAVDACGLAVLDDPLGDPQDIGPAHALVTGWNGLTRSQARRAAKALADAAVCTHPPREWSRISLNVRADA